MTIFGSSVFSAIAKDGCLDKPHVISLPGDARTRSLCLQIYGSEVPKSGGVEGFVGELDGTVRLLIEGVRSHVEQGEGERGGRKRGRTEDGAGDGREEGGCSEAGAGQVSEEEDGEGQVTVHGVLGYFTAQLYGGVFLDSRHSSRSVSLDCSLPFPVSRLLVTSTPPHLHAPCVVPLSPLVSMRQCRNCFHWQAMMFPLDAVSPNQTPPLRLF